MRDHPWHCNTEILGGTWTRDRSSMSYLHWQRLKRAGLWGAKVHKRRRDIGRVVASHVGCACCAEMHTIATVIVFNRHCEGMGSGTRFQFLRRRTS
jgi:hypothetical protein